MTTTTLSWKDGEDENRYTVNVVERLKELMGDGTIGELDRVTYTWSPGGYEKLVHEVHGGGVLNYGGAFHPGDGSCDTGSDDGSGICQYCGMTWL